MANIAEAVRRLSVEATTKGISEAEAKLRGLSAAQESVTVTARGQERATQSMERRLNSIQRQYDANFRATQTLEKVTRDLDTAQKQGLITVARKNELLKLATARLRDTESQARRTAGATQALNVATGLLLRTLALLGGVFSLQQLVKMTSQWSDLTSRVRNAIEPHESVVDVMGRLESMARRTYSSLENTAESYLLNSTALTQLGYSTRQQLDLTETLNNALVVTATKGQKAESVINAWSKAMALGKLSGDELNTVIQSGGRVAEALADSMGVSVSALRRLGTQGKITTKELFGITSQLETLRKEADAMPATIVDAFTIMGDAIMKEVGHLDQYTKASAGVASAIIAMADNADMLIPILGGLAAVITVALVPSLFAALAGLTALALSPIGLIAIGIGTLAAAATYLWNEGRKASEATAQMGEALSTNAVGIDTAKTASKEYREELRKQVAVQLEAARAALAEADAQTRAARIKASTERFGFGKTLFGDSAATQEADVATKRSVELDAYMMKLETQLAEIDRIMATPAGPSVTTPLTDDQVKAAEKAAKAYDKLTMSVHQRIAAAQGEAAALGLTKEAAERLRIEQDLLNQAANDNIALSPKQTQAIKDLAHELAAAEERTRALNEAYQFGKEVFGSFFSDLRTNLMQGQSLWEAFGGAAVNVLNKIAEKALSMAADGIWDMIFGAVTKGITGSIFGSLGNGIGGGATFDGLQAFLKSANGNVFQSPGLHAHVNTVVDRPTLFKFAKGGAIGEMGEAGPEAIMPLSRNSRGQLGVKVANENQRAAANDSSHLVVEVYVRDDGKLAAIARQEGGRAAQVTVRQSVPGMIDARAPAATANSQRNRKIA